MAKSFIAIKKGVGLYDIIDFGKYKGCRVDSIAEQDPGYIDYTRINFGTKYDQAVLDRVTVSAIAKTIVSETKSKRFRNAHAKLGIATLFDNTWDTAEYDDPIMDYSDWTEDVPF